MREALNAPVEALHRKRRLGVSVYEGILIYLKNRNAPDVLDIESTFYDSLTREKLENYERLLLEVSAAAKQCGGVYRSPFENVNISEYDAYDTAIMDLKAGRVDVIAVDQVLGEYTNNNLGGEMKECTYSLGNDYYTIGCASDNTELRDKLNEALKTLIDNGTAAEISEKWFGRDIY